MSLRALILTSTLLLWGCGEEPAMFEPTAQVADLARLATPAPGEDGGAGGGGRATLDPCRFADCNLPRPDRYSDPAP